MERKSSARSTGMFFGSPPPMKKWHLSAQAPQRTHTSMKILSERYFLSFSRNFSMTMRCQSGGSFQSSSMGFHSRGLGMPRYLRMSGLPG